MSDKVDKVDNAKKARDTLTSIYSFYATNRDTIESVPSFVSKSSGHIPIAIQVPSAEQTEGLKKTLRELLDAKEGIDGISDRDRQLMVEAANSSTIKRRKIREPGARE